MAAKAKVRQCCQCRDGEHDNYDDDVVLVEARDPDDGKLRCRGYVCGEHRQMFDDDGYKIKRV